MCLQSGCARWIGIVCEVRSRCFLTQNYNFRTIKEEEKYQSFFATVPATVPNFRNRSQFVACGLALTKVYGNSLGAAYFI